MTRIAMWVIGFVAGAAFGGFCAAQYPGSHPLASVAYAIANGVALGSVFAWAATEAVRGPRP
jgi:hypothetical protein